MNYRDFSVQIHSVTERSAEVRVVCPHGECTASRELSALPVDPWRHPHPDPTSSQARREVDTGPDVTPQPTPGQGTTRALTRVGQQLFAFLFSGQALSLWDRTQGEISGVEGEGIRIKLQLDLTRPGALYLAGLPWETLYHEPSGGFLALDGRTPLVRYLELPSKPRSFPTVHPWRILVLAPQPSDTAHLRLDAESNALLELYANDESVEILVVDPPTRDGLRDALVDLQRPVHAVHFMGHGIYDPRTHWGGLLLEDETGRSHRLLGSQLRKLLKGIDPPALFTLNGCDTGRMDSGEGNDGAVEPFAGAATALVQAGVPAVVAMRRPIRDDMAAVFSRHLHAALQAGRPADWAVSEARLRLNLAYPGSGAWAIPTFFTRVSDGRIVRGPREEAAGRAKEEATTAADLAALVRAGRAHGRTMNIGGKAGEGTLLEIEEEMEFDEVNVTGDDSHR